MVPYYCIEFIVGLIRSRGVKPDKLSRISAKMIEMAKVIHVERASHGTLIAHSTSTEARVLGLEVNEVTFGAPSWLGGVLKGRGA